MNPKIAEKLLQRGKELLDAPVKLPVAVEFTKNPDANKLLNDIKNYPHAFVLACVMNRQIRAERAGLIPYYFSLEIGGFEFKQLQAMDSNAIKEIFVKNRFHRFNEIMAKNFFNAIQKIHSKYGEDASKIWAGNPKSATIVRRFLEFDGIGIKIATMATNNLARDFKVPMQDKICIEISPDVHVKRVFKRIGFIGKEASNEDLIYCAKELNPEYPGIFDYPAFEIGRQWCSPKKPRCQDCYLNQECPKIP